MYKRKCHNNIRICICIHEFEEQVVTQNKENSFLILSGAYIKNKEQVSNRKRFVCVSARFLFISILFKAIILSELNILS